MMRRSTRERGIGRRRAEEDEESFTKSLLKKTLSKKTGISDRVNQYTFRSVMAQPQPNTVYDPLPQLYDPLPIRSTSQLSHFRRLFFLPPEAAEQLGRCSAPWTNAYSG